MDPYPYLVACAGLALIKGKTDEAIKYFIILSGMDFQSNKTLGYIYIGKKDYNNAVKYFIEYSKKFEDREVLYTIAELLKVSNLSDAKNYYMRAAKLNCSKSVFRLAGFVDATESIKYMIQCYCFTFTDNRINKKLMRLNVLDKLASMMYNRNIIKKFIEVVEAMMKYTDFDYEKYGMTNQFHRLYAVFTEFRGFINLEAAINCGNFLIKHGEHEYLYFIGLIYYGLTFPCMSNCIDSCKNPCLRDNKFHCKYHCGGPPTSDEQIQLIFKCDYARALECFEKVDDKYLTSDEIKNKNKLIKNIKDGM